MKVKWGEVWRALKGSRLFGALILVAALLIATGVDALSLGKLVPQNWPWLLLIGAGLLILYSRRTGDSVTTWTTKLRQGPAAILKGVSILGAAAAVLIVSGFWAIPQVVTQFDPVAATSLAGVVLGLAEFGGADVPLIAWVGGLLGSAAAAFALRDYYAQEGKG